MKIRECGSGRSNVYFPQCSNFSPPEQSMTPYSFQCFAIHIMISSHDLFFLLCNCFYIIYEEEVSCHWNYRTCGWIGINVVEYGKIRLKIAVKYCTEKNTIFIQKLLHVLILSCILNIAVTLIALKREVAAEHCRFSVERMSS